MSILRLFIPAQDLKIETPLALEDAIAVLGGELQERAAWTDRLFHRFKKPYEGKFEGKTFRISRCIRYRNSFLPVVTGEFESGDPVTLRVRMRMQPITILFSSIWLSGVTAFLCVAIYATAKKAPNPGLLVVPVGMILFFTVVVNAAFRIEAGLTKKFLLGRLKGTLKK